MTSDRCREFGLACLLGEIIIDFISHYEFPCQRWPCVSCGFGQE